LPVSITLSLSLSLSPLPLSTFSLSLSHSLSLPLSPSTPLSLSLSLSLSLPLSVSLEILIRRGEKVKRGDVMEHLQCFHFGSRHPSISFALSFLTPSLTEPIASVGCDKLF